MKARLALLVALSVPLVSCGSSDAVPWDTAQMVRELSSELRRSEGLASDLSAVEVLAWRVLERESGGPVEIVLLLGRIGAADSGQEWALVQGYRQPEQDGAWHSSAFSRDVAEPLKHLRPGETADGTWHAFQRFASRPTARDVCDFAAVDYLVTPPPNRRTSGAFRREAWQRAIGGEPVCDLDPG